MKQVPTRDPNEEPKAKRKKSTGGVGKELNVKVEIEDSNGDMQSVVLTAFALEICDKLSFKFEKENEFPTHYLEHFADKGTITFSADRKTSQMQKAELIIKIKEVIGRDTYNNRESEYGGTYSGELVKNTIIAFKKYYNDLEEETRRQISEIVKSAQVKALQVTDGSLNMLFVQVGHGDCTVIQTPAGKTFLIDCGSSGGFAMSGDSNPKAEGGDNEKKEKGKDEIRARLRVRQEINKMLGDNYELDFLILTHPDKDHYNKMRAVFTDKDAPLKIGKIYHSSEFSKYGESTWYTNKIYSNGEQVKGKNSLSKLINQVHFRYDGKIKATATPSFKEEIQGLNAKESEAVVKHDDSKPDELDALDKKGGLLIWAEANCRVSILSSNTNQEHDGIKDESTAENRGSVVVLVQAFGKKILLCGDATLNTEKELVTRYGDHIANIDILRVGHHGSAVTSSGVEFTEHVKAKQAWISESDNSSFHSPSLEVFLRLWKHAELDTDGRNVFFWSGGASTGYSRYSLIDCAGHAIGKEKFTVDSVARYLRKRVYLTATSTNTKIDISAS